MSRRNISPILLLFVILMGINIVEGGIPDIGDWLYRTLLIIPGILLGLSLHEYGHSIASYALGDKSQQARDRMSVNPLAHIDPLGFLAILLIGFGWAKPVVIDSRYYKHPRRDEFLVSIAGVLMNLIVAVVFSFIIRIIVETGLMSSMDTNMAEIIARVLHNVVLINIMLMVFNLLPIPPLDGFGAVTQIFNLKRYSWYEPVYQNGFLILFVLLMVGALRYVIEPLVANIYIFMVNTIMLG